MIRYCRFCGKQMERTRERLLGYDELTGNPTAQVQFVCPKRFERFFGHAHTSKWYTPKDSEK